MWLSPDSFLTHLCTMRADSAWFFTCGKAWMEGMTPYVDFADSKGPLLWLIYGIGYLISPTSYIGVFWLSVLAYTVTFAAVWRTARLFVGRRESLLVLAVMPMLMFYRVIHDEVRAEDFCMPWICIGIYCTCRALMSPPDASVRKYAFWLGVGMAWCLLIKWNLFVLMGGMALIILGVSFGRKRADGLLFGLLGIAALTLPFVMYFLWKGNLTALVQEYFVNTFLTTGRAKDIGDVRVAFFNMLANRLAFFETFLLVGIIAVIFFFCRRFRVSYWLLLAYLPFFLFFGFKPSGYYYFTIVIPFCVFLPVTLTHSCSAYIGRIPRSVLVAIVLVACLGSTAYNTRWGNLVFSHSAEQERWDEIQSVLQQKQQPRILVGAGDYGYGLLTRALPACKYWALQTNPTKEMVENRRQAIRARIPDFVLVYDRFDKSGWTNGKNEDPQFFTILRTSGYRQCYVTVEENGKTVRKAVPVYAKE